ncbi:MAG: c-type cytochrome [Mangrovicoccus sp.]
MFDTMTFTKVAGGFFGAFLVYLLGGWLGEALFATGHHGSDYHQAYVIETDDGGAASDEPVEEVDFATLVAEADAAKGEKVFGKCKACHKVDGTDGTGPHLNGVVGRGIGSVGGFGYSDVLAGMAGDSWTAENLNDFLTNPKGYAPGTKMSFAGLKKIGDRANIVAYLQSTGG